MLKESKKKFTINIVYCIVIENTWIWLINFHLLFARNKLVVKIPYNTKISEYKRFYGNSLVVY